MMRVELYDGPRRVFAGAASAIVLPCEDGELTVLPDHAPTICALSAGAVTIDGETFPVGAGVARIDPSRVLIVMERA